MNKILIAGGSGFLGKELFHYFKKTGNEIKILTRNPSQTHDILWDAKSLGDWTKWIDWADILINLTGKSVDCRYNQRNKDLIFASRMDSTKVLGEAVQFSQSPPETWINASTATIYIHSENEPMTEKNGKIGDDFSMSIAKNWEKVFFSKDHPQTRQIAIRTSIVMGKNGGAFPMIKKLTKFRMGGKQGNGKQMISWIHILDFCRAIEFLIANKEISGAINITAPNPVQNQIFMKSFKDLMGIKLGISQPEWMLNLGALLIGTETELLLKSRFVIPEKLMQAGFTWEYESHESCLDNLLKTK